MTKQFDNTLTLSDENGKPLRFLLDPLDEQYIVLPGDSVPDGMLPPEDFVVRRALVEMKFFTERLGSLGIWVRLFKTKSYRLAYGVALQKQRDLKALVNSSREHKAAMLRIVNAMPLKNGGREVLAPYIE